LKQHLRTQQESPVILMARIGSGDLLGQFEAYCPIPVSVLDAFDKKMKEAEDALKPKENDDSIKLDKDKNNETKMDIDEKESTKAKNKKMDTSEDQKTQKDEQKNINKKKKIALRVTAEFFAKHMVPLNEACAVETAMKKLDDDIANIQNTRNFLETLIYEVRDKLEGQYKAVVDPRYIDGHKETITNLMYKLEDEEEISKDVMTYTRDIDIIRSVTKPLDNLLEEHRSRPDAVATLTQQIKHYHRTAEKANYMDHDKKKKVIDKCTQIQTWLAGKLSEQERQPMWVNVAVTVSLIKQKLAELNVFCTPLCKEPTPPPPPPAEEKTDASTNKGDKMETDESANASTKTTTGGMEAEPNAG